MIDLPNERDVKAKESADELIKEKAALDAKRDAKMKEAKEQEVAMRAKASTIGNIVGKGVPVSMTEVRTTTCI